MTLDALLLIHPANADSCCMVPAGGFRPGQAI
jgi:hypothetical protein